MEVQIITLGPTPIRALHRLTGVLRYKITIHEATSTLDDFCGCSATAITILAFEPSFPWEELSTAAKQLSRAFEHTTTGLACVAPPSTLDLTAEGTGLLRQDFAMNAWIYTHLPSTIIRSEHPEDLLVFLDYISHKESTPRLHLALTSLWTYALDVVARLFALPVPNRASADFELPPGATPLSLYMSKSAIDWGKEWASFVQAGRVGNVRRITENHVMKCGGEPHEEVQAISLVSFKTRILVPQARIVEKSTLILDLVSGVPLSRCWDKLGLLSQFRICCTVRTYIRQLRNLPPNEKPGPMTGSVRGALFEHEDIYNVFPTWMRFQCWCEALGSRGWRTLASLARHDSSFGPIKPLPPPCSGTIDFRNLVFTHGDLHLGNLMLDTDGSLWIIDWDDSGYYPVWFESLGMIRYRETLPRSWIRWIWFMAGSYPDAELLWSYVREAIYDRI